MALGAWVRRVRALLRAGSLDAERAARLEALDGWQWKPPISQEARWDAAWEEAFVRLRAWAERSGHAAPRQDLVLDDGFRLGGWVAKQRARRRAGRLSAERARRLAQLPGWRWGHDVGGDQEAQPA